MNNNNENEVMAEGNGQVEAAEAAQRAQEAVERETARVAAAQAAAAPRPRPRKWPRNVMLNIHGPFEPRSKRATMLVPGHCAE